MIQRPTGLCDFLENFIARVVKTDTDSYPGDDYAMSHKLRLTEILALSKLPWNTDI